MNTSLPNQKNLIPISEAAKVLGVSIDTIRRWDRSGVLHSERPDGKNRYFSLEDLQNNISNRPLSISEVSKKFNISATTLRRLEARGIIKPSRNKAGERVYDKNSIKTFLESNYFRRKNHDNDYFLRKKQTLKEYTPLQKPQTPKTTNPMVHNSTVPSAGKVSATNNAFSYRLPETLAAVVIFILLSAIGVTNITLSELNRIPPVKPGTSVTAPPAPVTSSAVLSETAYQPVEASASSKLAVIEMQKEATESADIDESITLESIKSLIDGVADFESGEATKAAEEAEEGNGGSNLDNFKVILSVKTRGADFINIREKPSTESAKIHQANNEETFEMVSRTSDWYEIKLNDQSTGFISEEFAYIKEIK